MSTPVPRQRPLSPHLQIYRPQITSVLSIMHRGTGVVLSLGTMLLIAWLLALATGESAYSQFQNLLGGWVGRLVLFGFSLALFYHLCNGIRHLFWDAGKGFDIKTVERSGIAVLVATVVLTLGTWIAAYCKVGAY